MAGYRDSSEPVFDHTPSGEEIARWFRDEEFARRFENVGGDAVWISRNPLGTLHKLAEVDHDDQMFYLLDITVDGVHDWLFVTAGLREPLFHAWYGKPIEFWTDSTGLLWFVEKIEEAIDRQTAEWHATYSRRDNGDTSRQSGSNGEQS